MDSDRRSRYINQAKNQGQYINIGLDIHTLDILCKMVISQNKAIRRTQLANIMKLINSINPDSYKKDPENNP